MGLKTVKIGPEAAEVMRRGSWEGEVFILPAGHLDRALYVEIDKALQALGGKWNRHRKGHVFSATGHAELVAALDAGHVVDQKKTLEQFYTPPELGARMARLALIEEGDLVLEPSAGSGRLVEAAFACNAYVVAVEIDWNVAQRLPDLDPVGALTVYAADFMTWTPPAGTDPIDCVLMNPPFSANQDIKHVLRALDFLRPGGRLVAIMSPHFTFAQDAPSRAFRKLIGYPEGQPGPAGLSVVGSLRGEGSYVADASVELLPAKTFTQEGTNVSAVLVMIEREG